MIRLLLELFLCSPVCHQFGVGGERCARDSLAQNLLIHQEFQPDILDNAWKVNIEWIPKFFSSTRAWRHERAALGLS